MVATTTLIITAIVTAAMAAGAVAYNATDGFGGGNKVKSSLDIQREREAEKAVNSVDTLPVTENNGHYFVQKQVSNTTQPTRSTYPTQPTQPTKPTLPTAYTLPTLQTGYRWQEIAKPQAPTQPEEEKSKLFIDRYDTQANNGLVSTTRNFVKDYLSNSKYTEWTGIPRWALALLTGGVSEFFVSGASFIDNFIWDLDGNGNSLNQNVVFNPYIEMFKGNANFGQALLASGLNSLTSATEIFDILANPIKGIASNGWQGFLDSFGINDYGYVAYDWGTGNFGLDLLAELLSDPLTVVNLLSLGKSAVTKGTKFISTHAGRKLGKETAEEVAKTTSKTLAKVNEETIQKTAEVINEVAPEILSDTGINVSKAAQKKISKEMALVLADRGISLSDSTTSITVELVNSVKDSYTNIIKEIAKSTGNSSKITIKSFDKISKQTLKSIIQDSLVESFKSAAKKSSTYTLKKLFKNIAKFNIDNSNQNSRYANAYARKIANSIEKRGIKYGKKLGQAVNAGSITTVTSENGKLVVKTVKTVDTVEDTFKASETLVQTLEQEFLQGVIADASKLGIPMTPDMVEQIGTAVREFTKNLELDKMTAQIMSATGILKKQAKIARADKVAGWLSKASKEVDLFQAGLNKLVLYSVAPSIPLLGKALGRTPVGKLMSRGAHDLLTVMFAKLTNDTAYRFQKALQMATKELTPETYELLHKTYVKASNLTADALSNTKISNKEIIRANQLATQTGDQAFYRQWYSTLAQDWRTYEVISENAKKAKLGTEDIKKQWEAYLKRKYNKNAKGYLEFLETINEIEYKLTGARPYSVFIQPIKQRNAFEEAKAFTQAILGENPEHKIVYDAAINKLTSNITQGRHLNPDEFLNLSNDIKVITREQYNKAGIDLANNQYYICTRNKVIVEDAIYDKVHTLLDDYIYYDGTRGLLAELKNFGKEADFQLQRAVENIESRLYAARRLHTQLEYFRLNPALYAVTDGNPVLQKELYIALADTFMGLSSKVAGVDNASDIAIELATVAELMLKTREVIEDMPVGFLTNDPEFMMHLEATIKNYLESCPKGQFMVPELKDIRNDLKLVQYYLETSLVTHSDLNKLYTKLEDILNTIDLATARVNDVILIIPNEVYRTSTDITTEASIQAALMKAAKGSFSGTITEIADGINISKYFPVSLEKRYPIKTVEEFQKITDQAENIYNRMYFKPKDPKALERIETTWDEILKSLSNDKMRTRNEDYLKIVDLLNSTKNLDADRKYALLKVLYSTDDFNDVALKEVHQTIKAIIDSPAYYDVYRNLKNLANLTNTPVSIGAGYGYLQTKKICLIPAEEAAVNSLQTVYTTAEQVKRGAESVEMLIKDVQNADPLHIQALHQTKTLRAFYDDYAYPYIDAIEDAVNQTSVRTNLLIAETDAAKAFLSDEDLQTLKDLYLGISPDPDKITQLVGRVDAYNKTVISVDYFKDTFKNLIPGDVVYDFDFKEFKLLYRKQRLNISLTPSEQYIWDNFYKKNFKSLIESYEQFVYYMTSPHLTREEFIEFCNYYSTIANRLGIVPNYLKDMFVKEYSLANKIKITIEQMFPGRQGYSTDAGRSLAINSKISKDLNLFKFTFKHESVHSALNFQDLATHYKNVEQYWNSLMKTEYADMVRNYYLGLWWLYKKNKQDHYFTTEIFTWGNRNIKEEVMANLIAGQIDPSVLRTSYLDAVDSIPQQEMRLFRGDPMDIFKFEYNDILLNQNELYFNSLINNVTNNSPNRIYRVQPLQEGDLIKIDEPFEEVDKIVKEYQYANTRRIRSMLTSRLSQTPEEMAKDLARTGPFHFYSISTIKNTKKRYSLYKYFDENFKIRPKEYEALEKAGVHILVLEDMDTVMFYIDKNRVAYRNGVSYYDSNPVEFTPKHFGYTSKNQPKLVEAGDAFNYAALSVTGQTTGYSNGFRLDDNFINTVFYGVKDRFDSEFPSWIGLNKLTKNNIGGWTAQDLMQPLYYSNYRFNEMLIGTPDYARRFGAYFSSNPMLNMSNALQQMQAINKPKMELLTLYFDDMYSISGEGIWSALSDEEIFDIYMKNPEMVLMTMRGKVDAEDQLTEQVTSKFTKFMLGDQWNPVRIQEFIPYSVKDIAKAREIGARFVPRSWYNQIYNTINNRIGSGGLLKYINRYNYIYKFFTLVTNVMTFVRNAVDTYSKNIIELGEDMPQWTAYAWKLQSDYQNVLNTMRELGIHGDKAIREFFESGMAKAYVKTSNLTYEMFKDLQFYESWGPSTSGLADLVKMGISENNITKDTIMTFADDVDDVTRKLIEPTDDEIMRMIARDTVPGYKGMWENFVDMTGQVFDFANNTIGVKAEKVNRLALYLKAISEGKTREKAFHWITKTHFDYSVRNLYSQFTEMLMPFMTFTTNNLSYWLHTVATKPWVTRYLMDYFQTQMAYYDFTPEQMKASKQWQYLIKSGNIPVWKRSDGMVSYFKLNPSIADAFNTFINPLEVAKDRLFFPTKALDKALVSDYKGQNLFSKQTTWGKIMDLTAQIPGNALAKRITTALKQTDTGATIGELSGAIGHINPRKYYRPKQYGYRQRIKYIYNRNNENNRYYYKSRLVSQAFRLTQKPSNAYKYAQISQQVARWRRARNLDLGKKRILDPYRALGRNLAKSIFFSNTLPKTKTYKTKAQKRYTTLTRYRIQRGYFNR